MILAPFREFLSLAANLNISRTAASLYISQSNLSRHIKQLESSLEIQLLERNGNSISLTPCGKTFANGIKPIVDEYDNLISKCRELDSIQIKDLTVMDAPYNDESTPIYISLLRDFRKKHNDYSFKFVPTYRVNLMTALNDRKLDLAVSYRYGEPNEQIDYFRSERIIAKLLTPVHFSVFCRYDSPISLQNAALFEDFKDMPIFTPNDECNITMDSIVSLFNQHTYKPLFRYINSESKTEFYSIDMTNEVFILPSAMKDSQYFQLRSDLVSVPLDESLQHFHCYAIASTDGFGSLVLNSWLSD
ncbi:LysR family transcriptional regulator [Adlercreutzia sp. ZJ154]|uniref:LysR family transcriptional regulator n=1 Tax=Adlercreutzia sp. ZJ154 TaxID=2709790 RepID=UPI0013EBE0A5|nr:LysR family transcriptional regulator [Adlercreutzia sp. ZJ154]